MDSNCDCRVEEFHRIISMDGATDYEEPLLDQMLEKETFL